MQEDESIKSRARNTVVGRHRAPEEGVGKRRVRAAYVAGLAVAAAGLGVAGWSAATAASGDGHQAIASATDEEESRITAAQRADRSGRDASSAGAPAAASSALAAGTQAAPSSAPSARAKPVPSSAPAAPSATATKKPAPRPAWVSPLPGAPVTSCYGMRWGVLHAGIDLADPANTPIHAAGAGTVVTTGWAYSGYGISVVIDHGNGYLTHYAHQNKTVVRIGQKVAAGDVIGYEGSTGDSTGPHLHFEVHKGLWNQIDPAPWMRARGVDLGC